MEITGLLTGGERVRGDGFLVLKLVFSATEFSSGQKDRCYHVEFL